jgi:hypothetical protein
MAMPLAKLRVVTTGLTEAPNQKFVYKAERVPLPHSDFESYILHVTPRQGLCKINAVGEDVDTSVYGVELRRAFDEIVAALNAKYGEGDRLDKLAPQSIWNEANEWMMALKKKERILMAIWPKDSGGAALPDNVKTIGLEALALSTDKGYLRLVYEFANLEKCIAEVNAVNNAGL